MEQSLAWLGLDWDHVERQSAARERHEHALDRLASAGRLYPCSCSRADLRSAGQRAADGSLRYTGKCRARALPAAGWRSSAEPLRLRLDATRIEVRDESGEDFSQDPVAALGDPIVRRRDGATAYALAAVVDDAAAGVDRVVRGRDLAVTTATQNALRSLLGLAIPAHRHHFLLLEPRGDKLAKLHGSVSIDELRAAGDDAGQLCAILARMAGLMGKTQAPERISPGELCSVFSWERVRHDDLTVSWDGVQLAFESDD
jgi:glutamyl-tRNA synthetase/glutamyl-Q tRNA(Asp) synthetase